jgi:sec-independent protein translocase protein TatC
MPVVEHLYELRNRLAKATLAIIVRDDRGRWHLLPARLRLHPKALLPSPGRGVARTPYVLDVLGQFQVRLRIAAIAGSVLSSPIWLYQFRAFITPAVHRRERQCTATFLATSLVLFASGVTCAYLTIDQGLQFLLTIGG